MHLYNITFFLFSVLTVFAQNAYKTLPNTRTSTTKISSTSSNKPISYESCKANCRSIHSSTSKSLDWCFEDCIKFLRNKPVKTLPPLKTFTTSTSKPGKTLPPYTPYSEKTISTTTTTTSTEVLAISTSSNEPTSYESCKANCRSIHSSTSKSLDWCFEDCIKFLRNKPGKTLTGKTLPGKTISTTTTTTTTSIEVLATSTSSNEPTSYESCKANCRSIHSSTSKSLDWCFEDCIKFLRNKTEKTLPVKTLPPLKTSTTSTTKPGKTLPPLTSSTTSTKSIPTSTKTTPISTKTIPISTKTIPTGDCVPSTVTVKEKITITEKVTVTVTNNGQQTPIVQENCAGKYGQCGGKGFNGPTCCQQGLSCKLVNEWYSQCL